MPSATLQAGYHRFNGVRREKRVDIAASLRRKSKGCDLVEKLANNVPDRGDIGTGAPARATGHVSAINMGNVGHESTSSAVGEPYAQELPMSYPEQHKILSSPMHLAGSLKAPLAQALRRATKRMRNAAKEIARVTDRHENTAKNWLRAENEMSATELVALMREFDEVAEVVMTAAGLDASLVKLRALKALLEE